MATILVIEDDVHSANIVRRVLSKHGHTIVIESEGLSGLRRAGEGDIDLILLDLGLPDIGGHTIAALINRIPGNIPVVAVTGSADEPTRRRALTYGCDGYITKPIDTRSFPDQIAAYLNGKSSDK